MIQYMLMLQCVVCSIAEHYNQPSHNTLNQLLVLKEYTEAETKNILWGLTSKTKVLVLEVISVRS